MVTYRGRMIAGVRIANHSDASQQCGRPLHLESQFGVPLVRQVGVIVESLQACRPVETAVGDSKEVLTLNGGPRVVGRGCWNQEWMGITIKWPWVVKITVQALEASRF